MRITRLRLTDFKAHAALEIEPSPGLTVVRGPNEAGKSSIAKAIEMVLFRKADANREDVRQAWAWGASSPPEVSLDFEFEGQNGTIVKRFGGSRSEAELRLDDLTTNDHGLIGEQVARMTGIPSEAFFRATASVGHGELDALGGDEPILQDRLQKAVSGADRGTAKAKKKLETAIHRYRTEGHKNPGLLKVLREEIGMLEGELATGEAALASLQSDRAQWVEAHERREELDVLLRRQQADLAEAQRAEALAQQRDGAVERYERLKRAAELVEESERLQRALPTGVPLSRLRSVVPRASSLQFEISELEAEVSIADEAAAADDEPELKPARPMRWLALAALLVALGWSASFLLSDAGIVGVAVVLVLALGVIVTLVQAVRMAGRRRRYGLAMRMAETASTQRADSDRARQEQIRRKRRELESALATVGVDDVEAAESLLASVQEQTEALAHIEGELRGSKVEERNLRRLGEARDEAANEAERANHALAAMGKLSEEPASARLAIQRLLSQTLPERDAARSEEDQAQGRVDANQVDAEMVASLAERLARAREQEAELERRLFLYQGTLAAIESAERATLKTAARYLEERMGPTISTVTDGRYDDIEVDEQSLAFKVRAPETGELVDVAQLSQGTADQLFLAARLGLVRLVTLDRRPPLILDDPFVTFDTARGERALRVVKKFASEHGFQVLYLTCSDRFDKLADALVVLPGPSNERVLAMPRKSETEAEGDTARPVGAPRPTLTFAPDPRPNPDPVAPRRVEGDAAAGPSPEPEPRAATLRPGPDAAAPVLEEEMAEPDPLASFRRAAEAASQAEHDTGVADPFRLQGEDRNGGAG